MPAEPKKKHSKARKRTRRAAVMLQKITSLKCKNCGQLILSHQVCKHCGFYRGKQVQVKTGVKVTKA